MAELPNSKYSLPAAAMFLVRYTIRSKPGVPPASAQPPPARPASPRTRRRWPCPARSVSRARRRARTRSPSRTPAWPPSPPRAAAAMFRPAAPTAARPPRTRRGGRRTRSPPPCRPRA
uniref:Uncharacterized protein n=1 Tax=Triticum urartu TaxID=4572 RepID=A0A8R7TGB5_TRIUA